MKLKGILTILLCLLLSVGISLSIDHFTSFGNKHWWWSLIFFSILFFISNLVFESKMEDSKHSEAVFGTIILKTLLLMVAIFLYSLYNKPQLGAFSVHFIAHYILFTIIEIRYLLGLIKKRVV